MADDRRPDGDVTRHSDSPAPPGEDEDSSAVASETQADALTLSKQLHDLSEQLHKRLAEFHKLMGQERKQSDGN